MHSDTLGAMTLILHTGGLYMTEMCAVYEIVDYRGDNDGFCFLARPCRFTAPFKPLKDVPMQWFTVDGYWSANPTTASELDLHYHIGERKDYPCPAPQF